MMSLTQEENRGSSPHKNVELISLIIALLAVFLPFNSTRMISEWSDSDWMHSTVFRFFYNLFTNENASIFNVSFWIFIRNLSYLAAIALISAYLINFIKSQGKIRNSRLLIIALGCLGGVLLTHLLFSFFSENDFGDFRFQRFLSFGFYVTFIGTLIPAYLNYSLAGKIPKIPINLGGFKKMDSEFSNIKNVTLIKRLVVGTQEFQPERRDVNLGFSWLTCLLSPFVDSLVKKEWVFAGIWFAVLSGIGTVLWTIIAGIATLEFELLMTNFDFRRERIYSEISTLWIWYWLTLIGSWSVYLWLAFDANKRYARRLIQAGWQPAQERDAEILKAHGVIEIDAVVEVASTEEDLFTPTAQVVQMPTPNVQSSSIADELMKLKELLDQGAISSEEYNDLKSRLLNKH